MASPGKTMAAALRPFCPAHAGSRDGPGDGVRACSYPTLIVTVLTRSVFPAVSTEKNLIVAERRRISGVWYTLLEALGGGPSTV
jgi:hypothetical protein